MLAIRPPSRSWGRSWVDPERPHRREKVAGASPIRQSDGCVMRSARLGAYTQPRLARSRPVFNGTLAALRNGALQGR